MATITVDAKGALRKLNRAQVGITRGAPQIVAALAKNVQIVAKNIAPRFTGKTAALITVYQKQTGTGASATVVAKNSTPGRKGGFNLPAWMHHSGGVLRGRQHIHSGHPRFMWEAAEVVRRQKTEIAKNILRGKLK